MPQKRPGSEERTASKDRRFSTDWFLRKHGFKVESRPRGGDPLWSRGGIVYSQREALGWLKADGGDHQAAVLYRENYGEEK